MYFPDTDLIITLEIWRGEHAVIYVEFRVSLQD